MVTPYQPTLSAHPLNPQYYTSSSTPYQHIQSAALIINLSYQYTNTGGSGLHGGNNVKSSSSSGIHQCNVNTYPLCNTTSIQSLLHHPCNTFSQYYSSSSCHDLFHHLSHYHLHLLLLLCCLTDTYVPALSGIDEIKASEDFGTGSKGALMPKPGKTPANMDGGDPNAGADNSGGTTEKFLVEQEEAEATWEAETEAAEIAATAAAAAAAAALGPPATHAPGNWGRQRVR